MSKSTTSNYFVFIEWSNKDPRKILTKPTHIVIFIKNFQKPIAGLVNPKEQIVETAPSSVGNVENDNTWPKTWYWILTPEEHSKAKRSKSLKKKIEEEILKCY